MSQTNEEIEELQGESDAAVNQAAAEAAALTQIIQTDPPCSKTGSGGDGLVSFNAI